MRRAVVVSSLLLPLPAFALSDGVKNLLSDMAPTLFELGVIVFLAHAAIYGVRLMRTAIDERLAAQVPVSADVDEFKSTSFVSDFSDMSTHLDWHVEAPQGGDALPDIDPALLGGFDSVDDLMFDEYLNSERV